MFNATKIQTALYGLVGFRNPFNPDYQKLDVDNTASRSGLFVTDNDFCKVEHIYDSQDYQGVSDANFNLFVKRKQQDSIVNVCSAVFNSAVFIDRQLLYKNAQNKIATENLPTGFVGYRIKVESEKNIAFSIKRIILDFDGTGDIKLLLFNTAKKAPIKTKDITITTDHEEVVLDWYIDNSDGYYKGEFYLGYINDGLTVNPFKRDYENSNLISLISFMCFEPIIIKNHVTELLWDLTTYEGLSECTGLNPDITVYNDYTDLIVNNENLFAKAIATDLIISCLSVIVASMRSNRTERNGDLMIQKIITEIEGQKGEGVLTIYGLRPALFKYIGSIKKEIEKLQNGYNPMGLSYSTMQ